MHQIILNLFSFLRSIVHFIRIIMIFFIMMLLLYWIQNLTNDFWAWTSFINPFLDFFLDIGKSISSGSINLFAAIFEFKYAIALIIFLAIYYFMNFITSVLYSLEETYCNSRQRIRKLEEDCYNKKLEVQNNIEQKKLKRFQVYIEGVIKPKFAHREYNIDLEEQNKILIKHLIEKTSINPQNFENGFVFTFENFNQIDIILDIFSALRKSKAPLDYIICVQVIGKDLFLETKQLKTLIKLKELNKIITLADTAYRYTFNEMNQYDVIQDGLFQKDGETFEVHEFVKKD